MGAQTVSEEELDALFAKLKQAVPESKAEELLSCRSVIRGLTGGGARSMSSEASEVKEKLLMRGVCFSSAPSKNQEEVEATAGGKTKQKKAHLQARRELLSEGDELHTDTWSKEGPGRQSRGLHFPSTHSSSSSIFRGSQPDVLEKGPGLPRRKTLPAQEVAALPTPNKEGDAAWDGVEGAGVWSDSVSPRSPDMQISRGAPGETAGPASSSCGIDHESTSPLYC